MSFADRMKEAAQKSHIRYWDIAELADISESTVSDYGCGRRVPSWKKAVKISDALNVSLDWLCEREGLWNNPGFSEKAPVGMLLRRIRKTRKLTREKAALEYGITEYGLQMIESGRSKSPRLDNVVRMANALNVSLDWLREMEENDG